MLNNFRKLLKSAFKDQEDSNVDFSIYERKAFEVEDINTRENFTFVYNPYDKSVKLYDTSRGKGKVLLTNHKKDFPFECKTAEEYFNYLYRKSIGLIEHDYEIYFLGWVDPDTIQPLAELERESIEDDIENIKEIKNKLNKLHNEIADTISNEKVKEVFKQNTYFAGGCIGSLIQNEDVNDYDLFFKDNESAYQVLKYYVQLHNDTYNETNKNYKIGVKKDRKGVTYLSLNKKSVPSIAYDDFETKLKFEPILFTKNAITLNNDVQIICRVIDKPQEVLKRFDFVHTMVAYIPYTEELIITDDTLKSLKNKQLIPNLSGDNIGGSLLRIPKFILKGYTISKEHHRKMLIEFGSRKEIVALIEEFEEFYNE